MIDFETKSSVLTRRLDRAREIESSSRLSSMVRMCRPASAVLGWLLALSAVVGCGRAPEKPSPTTYPVSGRVVAPAGRAISGGAIQFQSTADPNVTAIGEIQADGAFSLSYYFEGKRLPGTIAGPCRVTIIPPMSSDQSTTPFQLPQPYTVEAKENHFTVTLDGPKR